MSEDYVNVRNTELISNENFCSCKEENVISHEEYVSISS